MVTKVATTIARTTHCTGVPFPAGRTYTAEDDALLATAGVSGFHRRSLYGMERHNPHGKECGFSVTTWLDTQGMGFMPPTGLLCPPGEGQKFAISQVAWEGCESRPPSLEISLLILQRLQANWRICLTSLRQSSDKMPSPSGAQVRRAVWHGAGYDRVFALDRPRCLRSVLDVAQELLGLAHRFVKQAFGLQLIVTSQVSTPCLISPFVSSRVPRILSPVPSLMETSCISR